MTREEAIEVYNGLINTKIKEAFEFFAPELAESEDERIRKGIIEIIKAVSGPDCDVYLDEKKQEKYIAWLEKQKEQKPVVTHGETYRVDTLGTQQVIAGKMPQKPAEWDEKDEKVYDYLKSGFEYASNNPNLLNSVLSGASDATIQDYRNFIDKLKILRPQPKAEWSEEDVDMLNSCISSIEEAKENRYAYKETDGDTSYDYEIAWLKSLRPQNKIHYWTEEEIEPIISDYLTGKEHYGGMLARLRCLKPKPQWCPSEEQMKALNALNLHGNLSYVGQQNQLISLYQDLKKLM